MNFERNDEWSVVQLWRFTAIYWPMWKRVGLSIRWGNNNGIWFLIIWAIELRWSWR